MAQVGDNMFTDKIEIYGRDDCTYCKKAVELCQQEKVYYNYNTVGSANNEGDITLDQFKEMFPDSRTVPQITINGTHIGGFKELQAELKY